MDGSGTTEADEHKVAWIDAALDGDHAQRGDHVVVDDVVDGSRRFDGGEPERRTHVFVDGRGRQPG